MNDLSTNKQVCIDFLTHLAKGEFGASLDSIDDDVVWSVPGRWDVPIIYHGKANVKENLMDTLVDALAGDLVLELGALTAEEDRVAVEMQSWADLKNGKKYAMTYHYLFRVRDGLIVEAKEYLDTKHLAEVIFEPR
jgi:ketosteroid isomerase-like protein